MQLTTTGRTHLPAGVLACIVALLTALGACTARAEEAPTVTVISEAPNGLAEGDKANIFVKVFSWTAQAETLQVRVRATDWKGAETGKAEQNIEFKGNSSIAVPVNLPRYGPYEIKVALYRAGQNTPLREEATRLVRTVPVQKLEAAARANSWIGVNTHFNAPWQSLSRIGIHWARDYSWGWLAEGKSTPPLAGNGVDFAPTWRNADAAGITILPVLSHAFYNAGKSGWIEDVPRISDAYEKLSKAFPKAPFWELDNEPEFGFVTHKILPDNYRQYIEAAAAGLKRAGNNSQVSLYGTAGMYPHDTRELLRKDVAKPVHNDFGVVNYHYYTGGLPLEKGRANTNEAKTEMEGSILDVQREINRIAHAAVKQAWLTEVGWDVKNGFPVGERLQAIYLARAYLLARLNNTDKVFWYFDRDAEGTTKYSSCGLFDLQWIARPSAAALAALSGQVALATSLGAVDLGEDRWNVVLKNPDGGYVVAAWTVDKSRPLPVELSTAKAFDLFGNEFKPKTLEPEVAYFHLSTLPAAWAAQVKTQLISPEFLPVPISGSTAVQIQAGAGELSWEKLPAGVSAGAWTSAGGVSTSALKLTTDLEGGVARVVAVAKGAGWQRRWPITIEACPAVSVAAAPYAPGEVVNLELKSLTGQKQNVQLKLAGDAGKIELLSGEIAPDVPLRVALTPNAAAHGPLPFIIQLPGGAQQTTYLRPQVVEVSKAGAMTLDGQLKDWTDKQKLDANYFVSDARDFKAQAWLAWSPEGLWVAAQIPTEPINPSEPSSFWDYSNLELFVDSVAQSNSDGQGWGATAHQFYFVPAKTGN